VTSTVTVTAVNDDPAVASQIASKNVTEGDLFKFTLPAGVFTDIDSPTLTLSATLADNSALPAWIDFDSATGSFSGTPTDADVASYAVKVTADDGSGGTAANIFNIVVGNVENIPVIGGARTAFLAADDPTSNGLLLVSDVLTIDDPDVDQSRFIAETITGSYGSFSVDVTGQWTYTAAKSQLELQQLDSGESVTESFSLTTADGTTVTLAILINGDEDESVITGDINGVVFEDAALSSRGMLVIEDVDISDNPVSFPDVNRVAGDNGYGIFEIVDGQWTYTLNNGLLKVQSLTTGESLTDTYSFTSSDGSVQMVSITIEGTDDVAIIGGVVSGQVIEDGTLTASGDLTISDVDTLDNPVSWQAKPGIAGDSGYGTFALIDNSWTYTLINDHVDVQSLIESETLTDSLTFTATDGSIQQVTVTIIGSSEEFESEVPISVGFALAIGEIDGTASSEKQISSTESATSEPANPIAGEVVIGAEETVGTLNEVARNAVEAGLPSQADASGEPDKAGESDEEEEAKSAAEALASIDLSDALNVYKQVVSSPQNDQDIEFGGDVLKGISKEDSKTKFEDKVLDRFIDLANLNLNQVEVNNVQISDLEAVVRSDVFSKSLAQLGDSLDEALNEQDVASQLSVASVAGIVVGVSTGLLSQVLRAGALLASFMSVVPLWRQFDPLPILSAFDAAASEVDGDDEQKLNSDDEVEEIFDRLPEEDA